MTGKIRTAISLFILVAISLSSFYFWLNEVIDYLDFHAVITFSWMSVSLISIPIVFSFPVYWFFLAFLYEQRLAMRKMDKIIPFFKYMCIFSLVLSCALSFGYVFTLKEKGYIPCKGIPSGWMPGTATKYALDISKCNKS